MTEYTFITEDGDEVMVEADGFEHACNLMFSGKDALDPKDYTLYMIDDEFV